MTAYTTRADLVNSVSATMPTNSSNSVDTADIRESIAHAFDSAAIGTQVGRTFATLQTGFTPPAAAGGKWRVVKDVDFQGGLTMTSQDYVIFANCQISGASTFTTCDNLVFANCFIEATTTLTDCTKVAFFSCEEDTAGRIVSNDYAGLRFVDHRPRPNASSPWDDVPPFPEDMRSGWWFDPKAVTDVQIADVNKEDYGVGYMQQVKPINPRTHCVTYATYFTRAAGNLTRGGNGEALWLFRMGQNVTSKMRDGTPLDGSLLNSFKNGKLAYDDFWDKGAGWSIANNAATKTAGTASKLISSPIQLRPNELIKVKFDATVTAGTVTPGFSTNVDGSSGTTGTAVSTTSSFDSFVTNDGSPHGDQYFFLDASSDFAGSISNIELRTRDNSADGHNLIGPGTPVALPDDLAPTFPSNNLGVPHYGTGNDIEVVFDMYFPTGSTNWTRVVGNPSDWLFWQSSPVQNVGGAAAGTPPVVLNSQYINSELRWSYNLEGGNEGAVTSHDNGLVGYGDPIVENKWYRHRINFALSDTNTGYFHHSVNGEQIRTLTGIPLGWYHTNGLNANRGYITFGSYIASWNDGVGGNDPIDDTTNVKIVDGVLDFVDLYMANVAIKVTPL